LPVPVVAFNVTLPPEQNVVEPAAVIDAVGALPEPTTTAAEVVEQPLLETVTV
jgi:hypothetical protein